MSRFLLDTNVISETRKPKPHGGVLAWILAQEAAQICLPALVFGEIHTGIELLRPSNPSQASSIEEWLRELEMSSRILVMDAACFRAWARLMWKKSPELAFDAMVAATAQVHNLTVVTRNVRDFAKFGVPLLNPFEYRV